MYKSISNDFDVPLSFWTMISIPFFFFMFIAFLGRHVSSIFRMITGFVCTSFPLLIPAASPFMNGCNYKMNAQGADVDCSSVPSFTSDVFISLFMAIYVGFIGAAMAIKNPNFGHALQGFALSYITVLYTLDFWIGDLRQAEPELGPFMDWVVLGITGALGAVYAFLNIKYPDILNVFCSAIVGAFVSMQIVCVAGIFENWFWTFEVSAAAIAMGVPGCTVMGCYIFMSFWIAVTACALVIQFKYAKIDKMEEQAEATSFEKFMYQISHCFIMLMELNTSLSEAGEFHSPEEMEMLATRHSRTWVKATTLISDSCIIVFSASLWIGVVELLARGIMTKSGSLVITAIVIFVVSALVVLATFYEIRLHYNTLHEDQAKRTKKFNFYIWCVLCLMPCAVCISVLTWGISWKGDPIGVQEWIGFGLLSGAEVITLQSHMKVAAVAATLLCFALMFTAGYVSKHLGGWPYLGLKVSLFVAWLIIGYGLFVMVVGFSMAPDDVGTIGDQEAGLFHFVGLVGLFTFFTGLPGVVGCVMVNQCGVVKAKCSLKIYAAMLLILILLNMGAFGYAGKYISQIDKTIEADWSTINSTIAAGCKHADCANLQKAEFVDQAKASFRFILVIGIITVAMLFLGLIATAFLISLDDDTLTHAEELAEKHSKSYLDADEAEKLRDAAGEVSLVQKFTDIDAVKTKSRKDFKNKKGKKGKKKAAAVDDTPGSPLTPRTFDVEGEAFDTSPLEGGGEDGEDGEEEEFSNPLATPRVTEAVADDESDNVETELESPKDGKSKDDDMET